MCRWFWKEWEGGENNDGEVDVEMLKMEMRRKLRRKSRFWTRQWMGTS